jgi:endonuclease IV
LSIAICPNIRRALLEIEYAEKINAKGVIFHCGTRKISKEKWKNNLSLLRQNSRIPILLENSLTKACYGSNFKELLQYTQYEKNLEICFDTMH